MVQDNETGAIGTGRKVKHTAVRVYEGASYSLKLKQMLGGGRTAGDTRGLGCVRQDANDTHHVEECTKEGRAAIRDIVREQYEEDMLARVRGLVKQGAWYVETTAGAMWADLKWTQLTGEISEKVVTFICNAALQTLPTPDNIVLWTKSACKVGVVAEQCGLCGQWKATLQHIMTFCPYYFNVETQKSEKLPGYQYNRMTWRHDQVLRVLVTGVVELVKSRNTVPMIWDGNLGDAWSVSLATVAGGMWHCSFIVHAGVTKWHSVVSVTIVQIGALNRMDRHTVKGTAVGVGDVTVCLQYRRDRKVLKSVLIHARVGAITQKFTRARSQSGREYNFGIRGMHYPVCSGTDGAGRMCKSVRDAIFSARPRGGILKGANDWILVSDLKGMMCVEGTTIPGCATVMATSLRPDVVLYSVSAGVLVTLELTAGWDGNQADQHDKKFKKYADALSASVQRAGFEYVNLCVEVGCRGLVAESVEHALGVLGMPPRSKNKLTQSLGQMARVCSYVIWTMRNIQDFHYRPMYATMNGAVEWGSVVQWAKAQHTAGEDTEPEVQGVVGRVKSVLRAPGAQRAGPLQCVHFRNYTDVRTFDGKIPAT